MSHVQRRASGRAARCVILLAVVHLERLATEHWVRAHHKLISKIARIRVMWGTT